MVEINFSKIEEKWQKRWEDEKVFFTEEFSSKPKYYALEMFPYPSGTGLHVGHAWNFLIGDIISRFKKMNGFNVLHPMGFDALGLPAENAAIKTGILPQEYTQKSISNFISQQKKLGFSYDWEKKLNTSSPEYYKWDQWIFLKMFEKGLAYQKESNVNWCPSCKTVLANEQAQGGICDRCKSKVEIKYLKQWFLKITDYSDELYENINKLNWPEKTKAMQKNWIGKSKGVEVDFEVGGKKWPVFTTRLDTIFGVTFVVVSAQHSKLNELVTKEQKKEVEKFLKKLKSVSEKDLADMEKEGVFTGSYATNPATGEKVPIYAGNFVVADYGSGMVMAVPAHDKRDFEFAKKYGIKIKQVIEGKLTEKEPITEKGKLMNSKKFDGLDSDEAIKKIVSWLGSKKLAREITNFKLRDWGISRQRYWGTPIPIIHCEKCGAVSVSEKDLPVVLPEQVKFGEGNPLETNEDWIKVKCPKCGGGARRETDTMDTFVNSSWYFLRYCDSNNKNEIFDKNKVNTWCPVDIYIGGSEHACMHLIYSRFYTKFLADLGLINFREPFTRLFHQGFIYGEDGEKMSKSRGNTVDPIDTTKKFGVDPMRFFLVSVASPDKDFNWSELGIVGAYKFLNKIFDFFNSFENKKNTKNFDFILNKAIKDITNYYETFEYRKITIELRKLFGIIEKEGCSKESFEVFLKLLNPICPHFCEEVWEKIGNKNFIISYSWPEVDVLKLNSKKSDFDINEKIIKTVEKFVLGKKKLYLYAIPLDFQKIDEARISEKLGIKVSVFSTKDLEKYDPSNKAKKSLFGMPSFYLE